MSTPINLETLWDKTLQELKNQVNEQVFNAWFHPIKPLRLDDTKVTLSSPNSFHKDWVTERYLQLIKSTISGIAGNNFDVVFSIIESAETYTLENKPKQDEPAEKKGILRSLFPKNTGFAQISSNGVNPKYTFDNFVIGPSNRFSHAACLAVSESPAKTYNPLFIYGGVGLGKTHLMHAIGNHIYQKSSKTKIFYTTSEEFTNQLIAAIQTRTMQKFRSMYRSVDVLFIDDIHFIAGKESTQEEFFHTFNALYDAHKQIIMSSDRSPKEIPALEERLVSRFEWGLVTDIQPPDFETRMAILRKKSEAETVHVPGDVYSYLAENIKSNIRELEGALIRVVAYAKLSSKVISIDLAKEVLKGMIKETGRKVNVDHIQKKVSEYFNISITDMKAKKRTQTLAYPRQIAMYLSREMTQLSLPEIGAYFGGRDHTTVIHACNKIEKEIKGKEDVKKIVDEILISIKT